jgi:hypothetical protein
MPAYSSTSALPRVVHRPASRLSTPRNDVRRVCRGEVHARGHACFREFSEDAAENAQKLRTTGRPQRADSAATAKSRRTDQRQSVCTNIEVTLHRQTSVRSHRHASVPRTDKRQSPRTDSDVTSHRPASVPSHRQRSHLAPTTVSPFAPTPKSPCTDQPSVLQSAHTHPLHVLDEQVAKRTTERLLDRWT